MKVAAKRFIKEAGLFMVQVILIVGIVVLSVFPISCRITAEGIEVIGGDYAAPVLQDVNVLNDSVVQISFSESVEITDVVVSQQIKGVSDSMEHSVTADLSPALQAAVGGADAKREEVIVERSEDGKLFTFTFANKTQVGKTYEIFGIVHDDIGNSLTFCVPFTGYNAQVPKLLMTEIQAKYTKASLKTGVVYRSEFVEFIALSDGNLAGLELFSASDGEAKKYEFAPMEVKKGQIFLLHLRTVGEGCVSETDDLAAATAEYSCEGVLDLWSENTAARFNDSSDVIILRNSIDGSVLDGFMYAAEEELEWKSGVAEGALELEGACIYDSSEIDCATCSKGISPKKSFQRVEAEDIYAQVMSGVEIEYPVCVSSDSWVVQEVTPGVLSL